MASLSALLAIGFSTALAASKTDYVGKLPGPSFFGVSVSGFTGVEPVASNELYTDIYKCVSGKPTFTLLRRITYRSNLQTAVVLGKGSFPTEYVTGVQTYTSRANFQFELDNWNKPCGNEPTLRLAHPTGHRVVGTVLRRPDGTNLYRFAIVLNNLTVLNTFWNEGDPHAIGDRRAISLWRKLLLRCGFKV